MHPIHFTKDSRWLFIGDSITDYGRRQDPDGWGRGYVRMIAQWFGSRTCGLGRGRPVPQILNRAIAGDTIRHLDRRWEEDVLALKPDMISIKIGVNDVWARFSPVCPEKAVPVEEFHEIYDRYLTRLHEHLPDCQIVLCEPCGIWPPAPATGNVDLQPYLKAIRSLAEKHRVHALVPLHQVFVEALAREPEVDLMADGVHPTPPGDMLIAKTWMKSMGFLVAKENG